MLKKKNIYVITVTVIVSFIVIFASFLGLIAYLQWRQLKLSYKYYDTIERLDTISYTKDVELNSLKIGLGFKELPLVEAHVTNKGRRTINSVVIKINFLDTAGTPVYSYSIYPLEPYKSQKFFRKLHFHFGLMDITSIGPSRSVSFKYILWRCPHKFVKMIRKNSFADKPGEWCGKITGEVVQIGLKPL